MKKLIAFSLAAASSLVISSNAMALPASFGQTITLKADGGNAHAASCYLVRNNDGVTGSCDYECEEAGQLATSPTLSLFFREQKILGATNCNANRTRIVPTLLQILQGSGSMIFDQFEQASPVVMCAGAEGNVLACLLDAQNVIVPVLVTG